MILFVLLCSLVSRDADNLQGHTDNLERFFSSAKVFQPDLMNHFGYHANETRGAREQGVVDAERVKQKKSLPIAAPNMPMVTLTRTGTDLGSDLSDRSKSFWACIRSHRLQVDLASAKSCGREDRDHDTR